MSDEMYLQDYLVDDCDRDSAEFRDDVALRRLEEEAVEWLADAAIDCDKTAAD